MRELEALYFPYASVRDRGSLKSALLYFDKLWVISSPYACSETAGEFGELLQDSELVRWINGEDLASNNLDILKNAIQADISDGGFLRLARREDRVWEIYEDKGIIQVESLVKPLEARGNKVIVPYEQGEAFLLNMALLAVGSGRQRLIPLTDHEEHFSILRYKLRRGAKSQLARLYGEALERADIEALISVIGRELVEAVLPTPEEAQDIPLAKIKDFRNRYQEDRNKLRDALFLMMGNILDEEPTISPARLKMRIETLVNMQLRHLEHDRKWSTRIVAGLKTSLGILKAVVGALKSAMAGVPLEYALAGEAPTIGEPVLNYIDQQVSQLRTSDVTYLYRVRREFSL